MNRAYLLSLDESLRDLSAESGDEHVTDLAGRVKAIIAREEGQVGAEVEAAAARHRFNSVQHVDEQEQTEKVQ